MPNNITLIGMPGAGKSTVGVLLAKASAKTFIDTDLIMQSASGKLLQTLVDEMGYEGFIALEERTILALKPQNTIIAPGGSVVYSAKAMAYLKTISQIIYLKTPLEALERRLNNIKTRGVLLQPGQTLADLYAQRTLLYEKHATAIVDCEDKDIEEVINEVMARDAKKRAVISPPFFFV